VNIFTDTMEDLDQEWQDYINIDNCGTTQSVSKQDRSIVHKCPKSSGLRISTKVKVMYLNVKSLDIYYIYWELPMLKHWEQREGIIKKQIKYTCYSKNEYDKLLLRASLDKSMAVVTLKHVEKEITNHHKSEDEQQCIFKNVSKVTVGMSNKDILNYRTKQKGAFYNCFMLVLRIINESGVFKEVNIKIFNTGKMSFPGMISNYVLNKAIKYVTNMLSKILKKDIFGVANSMETVLINSNFSCKYFLNRNKLYNILKTKYNLHVTYDPCSYPGIQCKYFDNVINTEKNGQCICSVPCCRKGSGLKDGNCREVSFMIFRTGSVLIVGKCDDALLMVIYDFLKQILYDNYDKIFISPNLLSNIKKTKKTKRKYIYVDSK